MHRRLPVIGLCCVVGLGLAWTARGQESATAPAEAVQGAVRFSNTGMSAVTPAGWVLEGAAQAGGIARWTKRNSEGKIVGELQVNWDAGKNPLAEQAKVDAERDGADVVGPAAPIAGTPTILIKKAAKDAKGEPFVRIVSDRGGLRVAYTARGLAGGEVPMEALQALCGSVQYFVPEPVWKGQVVWASEPSVILNGEVSVKLPVGFQQDKITNEFDGVSQWCGVLNLGTGQSEVVINFKSLSLRLHKPSTLDLSKAPPKEFREELRQGFERGINAKLPVDTYVLGGEQRGAMTELAEGMTQAGQKIYSRAARLYDEGHILQVQVAVLASEPEAVKKWDRATEDIIESIRFLPAPAGK